jgi:hypothetical protein
LTSGGGSTHPILLQVREREKPAVCWQAKMKKFGENEEFREEIKEKI